MSNELVSIAAQLAGFLEMHGESAAAKSIMKFTGKPPEQLVRMLTSNEIWGGPGSIADQACIENRAARRVLDGILIDLGKQLIAAGHTNPRIEQWVSAFELWAGAQ